MKAVPKSYLFVPGNRADRIPKAAASGADHIIIDLEDAVGPDEKAHAREHAADWFANGGKGVVRINGMDTPWFASDLEAFVSLSNAEIMVPKANIAAIAAVSAALPGRSLIALIESVEGLVELRDLARMVGVVRLAFGNLDFGMDSGISGNSGNLDIARFEIVVASRYAKLAPPIDGVTTAIGDDVTLAADIERAKGFGFAGKLCIHPKQVEAVNAGFSPSQSEIDWARKIIDGAASAQGAVFQVDGKMVDRPVIDRAEKILAHI